MKIFERLLFVAIAAMLLVSCSPYSKLSKEQQTVVDEKVKAAYVRAIEKPDLRLEVTRIIPQGMPSKTSNLEYSLTLEGNEVNARLPFIGVSREPHYGGVDEISIVFDHEKVDLQKDFSKAKKGEYIYKFKGGEGYYKWEVKLELYDNGTAYIDCDCADGRSMNYMANITLRN
jgi:hypothetical protein